MSSLRLALGLLTVVPVGDVGDVDRRRARSAIIWAPLVGVVLGAIASALLLGVRAVVASPLGAVLAATLAVGLLAYLTRALHLDGLADTADALGSGRRGTEALAIARRGDVGPFGVATLVLMLLLQVAALAVATDAGVGAATLITAVVTGRLAIVLACSRGIRAARPDGLGALVAGTVPRTVTAAWIVVATITAVTAGAALGTPWALAPGLMAGLALAGILISRAVRRLGGITGDVIGASVETATTVSLLVCAMSASVSA